MAKYVTILLFIYYARINTENVSPVVITTWKFISSTQTAWEALKRGHSALEALEIGVSVCEKEQCDGTVGYGGSPNEVGETTLDALIMDGRTMNIGAVGYLRRIKNAISVARHILQYTMHSLLVGESATKFALQMGFPEESLTTPESKKLWLRWRNGASCQPNFWMNVKPDSSKRCGPYSKMENAHEEKATESLLVDRFHHDTIGMVVLDNNGDIAAGTSTNGAKFKIVGRVGDAPIPGAGAYADNAVGGAAATGDGDVMMRFLPSFLTVEEMRRGASPTEAAKIAVARITAHYFNFKGAVVALSKTGEYGAACHGIENLPFVVHDSLNQSFKIIAISCL